MGCTVAWTVCRGLWGDGDEEATTVTVRAMNKMHSRGERKLN